MLAVNHTGAHTNHSRSPGNLFKLQEFKLFKKLATKYVLLQVHKKTKQTRKSINGKGRN